MMLRTRLALLQLGLVAVGPLVTPGCRWGYELWSSGLSDVNSGGSPSGLGGELGSGGTQGSGGEQTGTGGTSSAESGGATGSGGMLGQTGGSGMGGAATGTGGGGTACTETPIVDNYTPTLPPPLVCSSVGALVCEDFENGQPSHWTVSQGPTAMLSLQDCLAHAGQWALSAAVGADFAQIRQPLAPSVSGGSLFVRTYVYLPSTTTLPDWSILFEIWDDPASADDKISLDLLIDGSLGVNNNSVIVGYYSYFRTGADIISRDTWHCVEMELLVHPAMGAVKLYVDDVEVASTVGSERTRGNKAFDTVSFGAVANGPVQFFQDDFVVATQRIGCD